MASAWRLFIRKIAPLLLVGLFKVLKVSIAWSGGPISRRSVERKASRGGHEKDDNDSRRIINQDRRQLLRTLVCGTSFAGVSFLPEVAQAGEIGARITKAVTQSDLGISVRQSVVRGAQVMDGIDGKWERFSDRFGLGSERAKQPGRPEPIVIKDPQPLQGPVAQSFLDISDRVFVSLAKVKAADLAQQIEKVSNAVRPSFVRSGLSPEDLQLTSSTTIFPKSGAQFNFGAYVHYKAYADILTDRKITGFSRKDFENQVGEEVIRFLLASSSTLQDKSSKRREVLNQAMDRVDRLCDLLVQHGFVAMIDKAPLDQDQVQDWDDELSELTWSIALNGDVTLGSQLLLQEQGFRLYPNYARYAVQSILESSFPNQKVSVEDYYLDTDYNSDPDKFEVKQVLLNIEVDSL